jgi:sugar (pentulose or hexulose) kinase
MGIEAAGPELILVFDVGTQSVRAALVDPLGRLVRLVRTPIEPYTSPRPGWAEQDPTYYWEQLCATSRKLLANETVQTDRIRGVTLTTQRYTVINLDRAGRPLRPAILWLDQRLAKDPFQAWPRLGRLLRWSRNATHVLDAQRACKSNWIRQYQPEVWARTDKFLLLSGFLTHRLTGNFVDAAANMVGYLPFDFKRHRWAAAWRLKSLCFPIASELLPDLVPTTGRLGRITQAAAAATSIPAGLPVIAAAPDRACEVLGAGCRTPEIACLSYGTTATINTANRRYVPLTAILPPYPAAIPESYTTEVMVYRGFWMVSWFKEEFGHREAKLAAEQGVVPETLFDDLVAAVPPGCQGLTLQPYWSPGFNTRPDAKGAIIGFGAVHTRAHLYRAILEGLAYALKDGLLTLQRRNGVPVTALRVSGGGSQSDAAMQITADIFDLPVQRPHTYETSALGAAICAAVGLGLHPDYDAAVAAMTRVSRTFAPIAANRDLYQGLFDRVYLRLYPRLASIYGEIQKITHYPGKD